MAIPALVAAAVAVLVFSQQASSPITGDGALILDERYPLSAGHLLVPLHRQLNALPIFLWAFLHGPAPKLALVLVLHVALTTVTAAFLVSRIGPRLALPLMLPLAVSGSAAYDLIFPWQIVFLLPMLLVAIATWLSVQRENRSLLRRLVVAGLLGLAVLSSNLGVIAIFALGLWFAFERRWTQIVELVPAAGFWAVWFVYYSIRHTHAAIAHAGHFSQASPTAAPIYIGSGIVNGLAGWFGLVQPVGLIVGTLVVLGFLGFVIARGIKIPPAFFAFFAAVFAMFAALSLIRSDADANQAAAGRYHYLVLFMLASGMGAAGWPKLQVPRWLLIVAVVAAVLNFRLLLGLLSATP